MMTLLFSSLLLCLYITISCFFDTPPPPFPPPLPNFRVHCFFVILHSLKSHRERKDMYQSDENGGVEILSSFTNKHNDNPSMARLDTCSSHTTNPTQISILPNPNKFIPSIQSYLSLHDITSINPCHAPSPSIDTILSQDNEVSTREQDEEQEMRMIKRKISNRESARRSRMRKRKQLENLQSQVLQLLAANHQLAEKLNHVMESNYQILQENARLREESFSLRKSVSDLLTSMKGDLEEGGACSC